MYVCMYVCEGVRVPAAVEGSDEQVVPVVRTVFLFTSIAFFLETKVSTFIYMYVYIQYVCV